MLDRAGYQSVAEKTFKDLIVHPPEKEDAWRYCIRVTSGTTGGQLIGTAFRYQPEAIKRFSGFHAPILCLGASATRLAYNIQARHGLPEESRSLALDGTDLTDDLTRVISEYKPDSIFGFVSFAVRVAEYIDAETASGIQALVLGGECITAEMDTFLREKFPQARLTMRYISLEVGRISEESCGYQARNHYHPYKGVRVEIDSPDEDGVGEVLVSPGTRPDVVRYRTGDVGRMKKGPCACGASETIELLGRNGRDYVKLAGALVRRDECDRVAKEIALFDDYRVEASQVITGGKLQGKLVLRVFRKDGHYSPMLQAQIEREFSKKLYLTPSRTLAELVHTGEFSPLSVEFSHTPFPLKHKEIKIVRTDI